MANKYLKRKFTVREIILLVVLFAVLFVGLYFMLVYYPLKQSNQELDAQLEQVNGDLAISQSLKNSYDNQKAAIEQFKENKTAKMPKCNDDQQQALYNHFVQNVFFGNEDFAHISFAVPTEPDAGVRQRRVTISFTVTTENLSGAMGETVYDRTIQMLHGLMNSGFRCAMTGLSLTASGDSLETANSIGVTTSISFYELA